MKITSALLLAAGTLMISGCRSTVRTLEYKNGRTLMTEEARNGGPPSTWELKVVASSVEKNTLRKTGWKFEGVMHHVGGADTFLMKRRVTIQTAARPPFRPILMTTFGTNTTADGTWQIAISAASLDLTRLHEAGDGSGFQMSSTLGVPEWTAAAGWFVYVESEGRVWAYGGDRRLVLNTETTIGNNSTGATYYGFFTETPSGKNDGKGPVSFRSNFPCAVPIEVVSRLSEPEQKAVLAHD